MLKRLVAILCTCLAVLLGGMNLSYASTSATNNVKHINFFISSALKKAQQGDLTGARASYQKFANSWFQVETGVKQESDQAYADIENSMGQVQFAFAQDKQANVIQALQQLNTKDVKFINGQYQKGQTLNHKDITLSDFIQLVKQTQEQVQEQNQQTALKDIALVQQSWLSVEGTVVAKSAAVYNETERNMVAVQGLLAETPVNYNDAGQILNQMIQNLKPLANQTAYSVWDAAMILLREGLEALLVVVALLAFIKKSGQQKQQYWIWSGVGAGLILSICLAVIVKFVVSSGAFGTNNNLISGWSGTIAAVMLLYVSYWLHSKSSAKDWSQFIRNKSTEAMATGKLVSLGFLAFLAVFREGTETVLFYIGMASTIDYKTLILGLLLGIGLLAILAYLMLGAGLKIPMRPFFMVSSIFVFYLCLKFTGMGIHSLQMAGLVPSTPSPGIPTIDFIALYPNVESAVPQLVMILIAVIVVAFRQLKARSLQQDTMQTQSKKVESI